MAREKFYLATAIAYASKKPHVGNDYEIMLSDCISRFKREQGYDVFMLTGTDEHGQKIEELARESGVSELEYTNKVSDIIKENYKTLNISNNGFIRTTDKKHKEVVTRIFKKLFDQGDIYKSSYEGLYCVPCESFWTQSQTVDGKCPDCGREIKKTSEEAYFFKMSKYQDRLLKHMEENENFILPLQRKKEMINNFLKPGLQDLCVSRSTFKWGVPVDFDKKHIIYVWIDALANYITATGYDIDGGNKQFAKLWPCDLHVIGKDILRFHTIYWPILLMALDLPLPKTILGHPWLLFGNDKMSKSKGNVMYSDELAQTFTVDGVRYYALSQMPYEKDGNITHETLVGVYNSELANTLGNLINRTLSMVNKYFDGQILPPKNTSDADKEFVNEINAIKARVTDKMSKYFISEALGDIIALVRRGNKYIDVTMPWVLAKDEKDKEVLNTTLYNLLECIRVLGILLRAFIPQTSDSIMQQTGADKKTFKSAEYSEKTKFNIAKTHEALFKRIDEKEYLKEVQAKIDSNIAKEESSNKSNKEVKKDNKGSEKVEENKVDQLISIDDFFKVKLKVAKVLTCEKVEKSDKLLKMTLAIGENTKTVVSGIAKHYTEEEMVGKKVVFVDNLKPAKLRGVVSEGMILCASSSDDSVVTLVSVDDKMEHGSEIF